jgi:hypothetical protein
MPKLKDELAETLETSSGKRALIQCVSIDREEGAKKPAKKGKRK